MDRCSAGLSHFLFVWLLSFSSQAAESLQLLLLYLFLCVFTLPCLYLWHPSYSWFSLLPFIASSEDPQDAHLFILATFVVLSGPAVQSARHLSEITWQQSHVAPAVTVNDECWCKMIDLERWPWSLLCRNEHISSCPNTKLAPKCPSPCVGFSLCTVFYVFNTFCVCVLYVFSSVR